MRLREESLSFGESSPGTSASSASVLLPLLTTCHSGFFCPESSSDSIFASVFFRKSLPMTESVSAPFVLPHHLRRHGPCTFPFFHSSFISSAPPAFWWASLRESSTNSQRSSSFNPHAAVCSMGSSKLHLHDEECLLPPTTCRAVCQSMSSRSFSSPSAETDIPGTSPCRILSSIFHPVDVLNVARMSPLRSTFAVDHGGLHSSLMCTVTLVLFSHLSSFPISVTYGFFLGFTSTCTLDFSGHPTMPVRCMSKILLPFITSCLDPDHNLQVITEEAISSSITALRSASKLEKYCLSVSSHQHCPS